MIRIKNLTKTYQDATENHIILEQLNLDIELGSSISIQGASGSGKSTLLHILAALDKPDAGDLLLPSPSGSSQQTLNISTFTESQADQYRKSYLGIVFQKFNLIDCISVYDNILLPAQLNQNVDLDYINRLAELLGIQRHFSKFSSQLSGGEQQRVAIARSLAHKPSLLLADEPTGNLDNKTSDAISHLLIDTCRSLNTTLVMVTHSEKVAELADKQYSLNNGKLTELRRLYD